MRLRQIAIACKDLDAVAADLDAVFGLKVAFRDPGIIHYGLRNAVLPAGSGFIEVLSPVREDASAARFLARRGGDAGYMLILQAADAEAERVRIERLGVRVVDRIERPDYRAAHFHPGDFGGVLASVDEQRGGGDFLEPSGDWWPAGPDWRAFAAPKGVDLLAVTLAAPNPDALAERFGELLARPLASARRLPLDRGEIRFEAGETPTTLIRRIDLATPDPAAVLGRARARGLPLTEEGVEIGGVCFRPLG